MVVLFLYGGGGEIELASIRILGVNLQGVVWLVRQLADLNQWTKS